MSGTADVKYDFSGLHGFVKAVSEDFVVKVGIFGSSGARTNAGKFDRKLGHRKPGRAKVTLTNAELGFIHEMGSIARGIPQRSFLRMPLNVKQKEILRDATKGSLRLFVKGDIKGVLGMLGAACKKWIDIAFATRGFGNWRPNTVATAERKHSSEPLIDTAQLRRSVSYKVDKA